MCLKKVYYNTYADGAQDIVEKLYPCREGRTHAPEVRKYEQKFAYDKPRDGLEPRERRLSSRFLGDLPTPRRSKSPSPLPRRESIHISGDLGSSSKHHGRRDRSDHQHHRRRSSIDYPPSPRITRSSTMSTPHVVVIDQDQSRFSRHDPDLGPVHIVDEAPTRRHSTRERSGRYSRRDTADADSYVVVNDERERRRHEREKRRKPTIVDPPPEAPAAPDVNPAANRRFSLRRTPTVVLSDPGTSAPSTHVHWEDKVRRARERQNAEISSRPPPESATGTSPKPESGLKGILKRATSDWRTKDLKSETSDLRRAVEKMDLPKHTGDDLDLWDRDRLRARFGSDDGDDRRRRTSKVWTGDRYQYL
ncbi:hypothetical protein OQA88_883 [Cercophora sp. LCS_1]